MNIVEQALSMTKAQPPYKAIDTWTSTRKIGTGTVQKILDEKDQRGLRVYPWCVAETLQQCKRHCKADPEFGDCAAYSRINKDGKEEGVCGEFDSGTGTPRLATATEVKKAPHLKVGEPYGLAQLVPPGGFFSTIDWVKKARGLDRDTLDTEWFCKRPGGGVLVYGQYYKDEPPFVVQPDEAARLMERFRNDGTNWPRVVGIDFGSNFAVSYHIYDRTTDNWYLYHEIFWTQEHDLPLEERARRIKADDPLGWNRPQVFADPSGKQLITDLHRYGILALPANNDVAGGIGCLKHLFTRRSKDRLPTYRVFYSCVRARKEFGELYRHFQNRDGSVNFDVVVKKDDHLVDSARYALNTFATFGTSQYRNRKIREGAEEA